MTEYKLTRSKRKTVAIYITGDAEVEVRAPLKLSVAEIDRIVATKQRWIRSRLELCEQRKNEREAFLLSYGDTVTLCGDALPIQAREGGRAGHDGECFYMPPGLSPEQIKNAAVMIFKSVAKSMLTKKAAAYAGMMGVEPAAVKVNSAKTRWGSCSGRNSVNFSWRLVMADEDVINYVVVHELAHIREHNHSPEFWRIVEGVLPDYKACKQKLKMLQDRLSREDW